jgi:hypothetical protein
MHGYTFQQSRSLSSSPDTEHKRAEHSLPASDGGGKRGAWRIVLDRDTFEVK